jgi:hypothetical protein
MKSSAVCVAPPEKFERGLADENECGGERPWLDVLEKPELELADAER